MERNWTENQIKAIVTPPDVLVNAAAGSGKTAVLVERIIRKIIYDGVSIERLLVVTFARDAAMEMQQRIKKALLDKLKKTNDIELSAYLKRQVRLLPVSDITTIDAFCINLVKKNFHYLGIDPDFKIMDAEEAKVLLDITADAFLDSLYEAKDERIFYLSKYYSTGFSDYSLKNKILEIFSFTRSLPNPKEWIRQSAKKYLDINSFKIALEDDCEKIYKDGIYPSISVLCDIVCQFDDFYFYTKKDKNTFEFNDLEHMCLRLLQDFDVVRAEYEDKYDELLMDEYQDTNSLQEAIFSLIKRGRFMVGDMKQSIYRFRKSDPFIFKHKDKLYSKNPDVGTRIMLSDNFRSRPQVLRSINQIFNKIMHEDTGEIDYDESQSLNWGNKSYENSDDESYFSELYVLEGVDSEEESESNTRYEARFIASKIREMLDQKFMVSGKEGLRPVTPEDFAIILSSVKYVGDIYVEELKKAGIDAVSESTGYFDKTEVVLMLSVLKIIDNPLQDIPLVTVMRSPIFGFTEDELSLIRMDFKGYFFDAVKRTKSGELGKKCEDFCEKLTRWREYSKYMSADKLIWTVYEQTNLYDLMGIMDKSTEAQANLRLLFERAKQYESTGFHGLYHFLNYMERMNKSTSFGGAPVFLDDKKPVRIMTIHKSKGLEFPVCFVAGMGKRLNQAVPKGLLMHKDYGIGIDYVNPEAGYFAHTLFQEYIRGVIKNEQMAEDMRKLYVAMTRAKEKLILTSVISKKKYDAKGQLSGGAEFEFKKLKEKFSENSDIMNSDDVKSANRYFDWIAPIVKALGKSIGWKLNVLEYNAEEEEQDIKEPDLISDITQEDVDALMDAGNFDYGNPAPGKTSVTGILKLADEDLSDIERLEDNVVGSLRRPQFLQEGGSLSGAERGNAYHKLMSLIDISKKPDVENEIKKHCSKIEKDAIDTLKIARFFESDLGKRLLSSPDVLREQAFEIGVLASEVFENSSGFMLIQGIIDCFFEEDGGYVLIDYKTDRNKTLEELKNHYSKQLLWYKRAVEKLTGKKVNSVYLYSFENDCEIKIS